jgi:hypothetical protein
MLIRTIAVKMGTTRTLSKGEVFAMEIEATVELSHDDSASYAMRNIEDRLRNHLEKAVERSITAQGAPRYAVMAHEGEKLAVILPDQLLDELHNSYEGYAGYAGYSLDTAREHFGDICREGYEGIDCSDGNLSRLPEIDDYCVFTLIDNGVRYLALVKAKDAQNVRSDWSKIWSHFNISKSKIDMEIEYDRERYEAKEDISAIVVDAINGSPDDAKCPPVFKNEIPF